MSNLTKNLANIVLSILILFNANFAMAAFENASEGADVPVCITDANMMTNNGSCRTTPTKYEVSVFEMGVCTSHPFTNNA